MTEEQMKELTDRMDDIAGMQLGLMNVLSLVIATHPAREAMTKHLPAVAEAVESARLNSQFSDRTLEASRQLFQQLTGPLRQ